MKNFKIGDRVSYYGIGRGRIISRYGDYLWAGPEGGESVYKAWNVAWESGKGLSPIIEFALVPLEPLTPFQQSVQDYIQAELG
jgi:hypothetical protein